MNIEKEIKEIKTKLEAVEKTLKFERFPSNSYLKKDEKFEECNGLMWSNSTKEDIDWDEARQFAKECRDGGFDDWRLPTTSELQNVFDYEKGESKIGGWDAGYYYWSATTKSNATHNAWDTNQYSGNTNYYLKTDATNSVRVCRGG